MTSLPQTSRPANRLTRFILILARPSISLIIIYLPTSFGTSVFTDLYYFTAPSGIIFSIFVNGLLQSLHFTKLSLYPDDAKASLSIFLPLGYSKLQRDLDSFVEWSTINGLALNIDRCFIISFWWFPSKVLFDHYIQAFFSCLFS